MDMKLSLLTRLESEHRKAERLLKKLEKADDASKQRPLVDELLAAMADHMRTEETLVYPVLEEIDGEMSEEAEIEHGLARDGLQTMADMIGKPGFGAAVAMVQAGIEHHVEEEESEVFPKIRKALQAKKPAAKKPAAKKPAPKKAAAKKPAAKRSTTTKKAAGRR
jgi:hemerythrin superfamily protein